VVVGGGRGGIGTPAIGFRRELPIVTLKKQFPLVFVVEASSADNTSVTELTDLSFGQIIGGSRVEPSTK
jgi:hypothetical protein